MGITCQLVFWLRNKKIKNDTGHVGIESRETVEYRGKRNDHEGIIKIQ